MKTAEEIQEIVLEELRPRSKRVQVDTQSISDDPATAEETYDGVTQPQVYKEVHFYCRAVCEFNDFIAFRAACKARGVFVSFQWERFGKMPSTFWYDIDASEYIR